MVATGWVGPEHMAEERVHFSREFIFQREGEFKREEFLKEQLENGFKREGRSVSWVFNLSLFDTSQWLS